MNSGSILVALNKHHKATLYVEFEAKLLIGWDRPFHGFLNFDLLAANDLRIVSHGGQCQRCDEILQGMTLI
ncbi:hypothetical protein EMIT0P294_80059 [Pseudomonas sp. IT-P294]